MPRLADLKRKREIKTASLVEFTFKLKLSSEFMDILRRDSQAQSCSAVIEFGIFFCLRKGFEYLLLLLFGNTDTRITDSDLQSLPLFVILYRKCDTVLCRCEFVGIVKLIHQYTLEYDIFNSNLFWQKRIKVNIENDPFIVHIG